MAAETYSFALDSPIPTAMADRPVSTNLLVVVMFVGVVVMVVVMVLVVVIVVVVVAVVVVLVLVVFVRGYGLKLV